jgi:hypothetical protein
MSNINDEEEISRNVWFIKMGLYETFIIISVHNFVVNIVKGYNKK